MFTWHVHVVSQLTFLFDFGDGNWWQAWNLLLSGADEVLKLRSNQIYCNFSVIEKTLTIQRGPQRFGCSGRVRCYKKFQNHWFKVWRALPVCKVTYCRGGELAARANIWHGPHQNFRYPGYRVQHRVRTKLHNKQVLRKSREITLPQSWISAEF